MKTHIRALLAPILLAIYPPIYLYQINRKLLSIDVVLPFLLSFTLITITFYVAYLLLTSASASQSAVATLIFLLGFLSYGLLFQSLIDLDAIVVDHFTLLPVILIIIGYTILFTRRLEDNFIVRLRQGSTLILLSLLLFNTALIIPTELRKLQSEIGAKQGEQNHILQEQTKPNDKPDIFYLVIDEATSFDAIKEYWSYSKIEEYERKFRDMGFFIASESRSSSTETLYEVASRLNFRYSEKGLDVLDYMQEIAENSVMEELKALGYTTIVYDQAHSPDGIAFPNKTPIEADYSLRYSSETTTYRGIRLSEYSKLVLKLTMLKPFIRSEQFYEPVILEHRDDLLFAFDRIANLDDIPSPKFIYAHLLATHVPFLFDANGNLNEPDQLYDWNKYLGCYIYAMKLLEELSEELLSEADPENMPIIIIQGDHGARNLPYNSGNLKNYPEKYKTEILNMLYMPGLADSELNMDMDPVDTFKIIFDVYLGQWGTD